MPKRTDRDAAELGLAESTEESPRAQMNGADPSGKPSHSRAADPKDVYGFAWRLVEKFGITAGFCIAMGAFIYWRESVYERTTMTVHAEFKASLDEQTRAVQGMTAAQSATNIELVKIGTALENHLAHDEIRHPR